MGLVLAAILGILMTGCAWPMRYYQLTVPKDMSAGAPNASGISLALGPLVSSHLYCEDRIVSTPCRPVELARMNFSGDRASGGNDFGGAVEDVACVGRYRGYPRSGSQADFILRGRNGATSEKFVNGLSVRAAIMPQFQLRMPIWCVMVRSHFYGQ